MQVETDKDFTLHVQLTSMKRARIVVSGLVQGIGYRSYARKNASGLGLKGFVRNLRDGRVEVVAEGYEKEINILLQILRKGPWGAKVNKIDVEWEDPSNVYDDFTVEV